MKWYEEPWASIIVFVACVVSALIGFAVATAIVRDDTRLVLILVGAVSVPIVGVAVYLRWQRRKLDRQWDAFFDEHGASMRERWAQMDTDDIRKGFEALDDIGMLDRVVDGVMGAERKADDPEE